MPVSLYFHAHQLPAVNAAASHGTVNADAALFGEFNGIPHQIHQYLANPD